MVVSVLPICIGMILYRQSLRHKAHSAPYMYRDDSPSEIATDGSVQCSLYV